MKEKKDITDFDKKALFNKEIKPLLDEIYKLCYLNEIPMYYCFAIKGDNNKGINTYHTNALIPESFNMVTEDERFKDYFRYNQGINTDEKKDIFSNFSNMDFGKLQSYQEETTLENEDFDDFE